MIKTHTINDPDGKHRTIVRVSDDGAFSIGHQWLQDDCWWDDQDSGASLSAEEARVVFAAARAAGYAAGMAYAIEKSAEVTDSFGHRGLSDLIRALAPAATTDPQERCRTCGGALHFGECGYVGEP